jgi:uncharacterized membrane protein
MDKKLQGSVDISLEKKLCAFGLLGSMVGGLIPLIGPIISLGGFVAYIIGIFNFSKKLNNGDIFKNFIISFVVSIIGVILFVILSASSIASIFIGGHSFGAKSAFGVMFFVGLFVLWLSFILSGFFSKKYLDIFYEYTNDNLFKYAGLGVLGGSISFGILSIIGWIIAMVAFFRMPDSLESNQS